jgi:hypothetical protein
MSTINICLPKDKKKNTVYAGLHMLKKIKLGVAILQALQCFRAGAVFFWYR